MIVACCLLQRVAHIEYCRVHSHGSLPIVAINESGGGCLPLLAARTRRRCRTPFDSIPRLPLSRLQRARLPMRSHAHALLASALIRLFASPLPLFASPLPLFALPLPSFASSAPVSVTQHSTPLGAYTWLLPKQSRCRCGSGGPGLGADVAGRVPVPMWPEWSGRRCGAHLLAQRPIRTTHHNAARSRVDGLLPSDWCSEYCTVPRRWRTGALAATGRTEPAGQNRVAAACDVGRVRRVGGSRQGRPYRVHTVTRGVSSNMGCGEPRTTLPTCAVLAASMQSTARGRRAL